MDRVNEYYSYVLYFAILVAHVILMKAPYTWTETCSSKTPPHIRQLWLTAAVRTSATHWCAPLQLWLTAAVRTSAHLCHKLVCPIIAVADGCCPHVCTSLPHKVCPITSTEIRVTLHTAVQGVAATSRATNENRARIMATKNVT
jgi:hypothetical protein